MPLAGAAQCTLRAEPWTCTRDRIRTPCDSRTPLGAVIELQHHAMSVARSREGCKSSTTRAAKAAERPQARNPHLDRRTHGSSIQGACKGSRSRLADSIRAERQESETPCSAAWCERSGERFGARIAHGAAHNLEGSQCRQGRGPIRGDTPACAACHRPRVVADGERDAARRARRAQYSRERRHALITQLRVVIEVQYPQARQRILTNRHKEGLQRRVGEATLPQKQRHQRGALEEQAGQPLAAHCSEGHRLGRRPLNGDRVPQRKRFYL